jgi:DMSO reductase family type II enzyme heme b subunit
MAIMAWILAWTPVTPAQEAIQAVRVHSSGPFLDPGAEFWQGAPATVVTMMPQVIATPRNPRPAVSQLRVRAAHNGEWIAVLIEWSDASRDDLLRLDQFGDQVAVEFPVSGADPAATSPMMGNPGGRVNIMQWRAALQRDIEKGPVQVKDLYPNALTDVYPDEVLGEMDARPYSGAVGLDNPVSRPQASPVLDQMAEGWGTMTVKPMQHAQGWGVWGNGTWRVVITRPMLATGPNDPQFRPGTRSVAAFAVWEGGHQEVGARKAWSMWMPFVVAAE